MDNQPTELTKEEAFLKIGKAADVVADLLTKHSETKVRQILINLSKNNETFTLESADLLIRIAKLKLA